MKPDEKLGAYVLPGRVDDPRPAIEQARAAEQLGLRAVWIGERFGTKDAGALAAAIGQATSRVGVGTAITTFRTRHHLSLASLAMTIQALTDGRFILGVGRSVAPLWRSLGLPPMTNAVLVDSADIVRRLCRGEKVTYDGPAGSYRSLRLGDLPDVAPPPIVLAAIGPRTLELAGAHFDGVLLHPFLTPEAVGRSAQIARRAAEAAGRKADALTIYATVVTASGLPAEEEAAVVGGRAVTYFQIPGFGEQLAQVNGWDTEPLRRLREHPQLAGIRGAADSVRTRDQLTEAADALPREWLASASAVGTPLDCARKLDEFVRAGADELVLHGSTPDQLGDVVRATSDGDPRR
jgi:5,10-methylenetetrahydromethanopterin reductase